MSRRDIPKHGLTPPIDQMDLDVTGARVGWNLRAARVTHCGPIRYQRRTEGKLFHDIYVEISPAPLVVIFFPGI